MTSDPGTVTARGLSAAEATRRLARDGPNEVPTAAEGGVWREVLGQLTHLLALLLWLAAAMALVAGMPELAVAIVVIVLVNAGFSFAQEYRADRSTRQLRALLPRGCRVLRDGVPRTVDAADVVLGDLVLLAAGDRVPADLVLGEAHELRLDESLVTGESGGVSRVAGERLLAGTFVVQGEATATVAAVGARTALADIAALARSARRPPSPLARQLSRVVRIVALFAAFTAVGLGTTSTVLGLETRDAFLFGVGVFVALVPEGLLPTVTLSLARGAQLMSERNALVRRLDAVETLGATTYICTDKTGTLTQNRMAVVEVFTGAGVVTLHGDGYRPVAELAGPESAVRAMPRLATAAATCVTGRVVERDGRWVAEGDAMEAALHALALRVGVTTLPTGVQRRPYTAERMLSSVLGQGTVSVLGAPEAVLERCRDAPAGTEAALDRMTAAGQRVLAVAERSWAGPAVAQMEQDLVLLGLVGLEDPPRDDVGEALASCRTAEIRVAMVTGDHPATAEAIAREVGLLREGGVVLSGGELPRDDRELGLLLDRPEGVVVARVTPADKFRIARVLRERGHVVAMTGDGVNDSPALREADVGVAMGLGGSDVARESADLVLLDDHFGTIVGAIELGRSTFLNVRRFLTYHLTDNVAELAPFAAWSLSGGQFPLALTVLQVLALDIGTDMLPAIALGAEPASPRIMRGRPRSSVVDRALLSRALGLLGATEAVTALAAFTVVLVSGGWTWGRAPSPGLLALASGTAFAAISLSQMANAFACRSTVRPAWYHPTGNRLVGYAVLAELLLLVAFLGIPFLRDQLRGDWPSLLGWLLAVTAALVLVLVDATAKRIATRSGVGAARVPGHPQHEDQVAPR